MAHEIYPNVYSSVFEGNVSWCRQVSIYIRFDQTSYLYITEERTWEEHSRDRESEREQAMPIVNGDVPGWSRQRRRLWWCVELTAPLVRWYGPLVDGPFPRSAPGEAALTDLLARNNAFTSSLSGPALDRDRLVLPSKPAAAAAAYQPQARTYVVLSSIYTKRTYIFTHVENVETDKPEA